MTYIFEGFDANNVRRVWGGGETPQLAYDRCQLAAQEYVQERPDTGPLKEWKFHRAD